MGLLNKLFGPKDDYPPLSVDGAAAAQLERLKPELARIAEKVSEDLEVVPSDDEAFVFIGKPPKQFGVAWIRDGRVQTLTDFFREREVPAHRAEAIVERIRMAYESSVNEDRYVTALIDKEWVVTPSGMLRDKMHHIVQKMAT